MIYPTRWKKTDVRHTEECTKTRAEVFARQREATKPPGHGVLADLAAALDATVKDFQTLDCNCPTVPNPPELPKQIVPRRLRLVSVIPDGEYAIGYWEEER